MKARILLATLCILASLNARADKVLWQDGRVWEGVRITSYRMANGVPQFYVDPSDSAVPADVKAGWFSGAKKIDFGDDARLDFETDARSPSPYPPIEGMVSSIVQGDTLRLDTGQKVRLLGVDTPETTDPERPLEFFGSEAYLNTKKEVEGRRVRVEFDRRRMDNFGRLLGYVYILPEERMLNLAIVQTGHGHAWTGEPMAPERAVLFREAETTARQSRIGLWNPKTRESARRSWQIAKPTAVSPPTARGITSRSSSSSNYVHPRRGRRRGVMLDIDVMHRRGPIWVGPFPSFGTQTELRVTPR